MAEARRLKSGKWRLYKTPQLSPVRDPQTGDVPSFESLEAARRWWRDHSPSEVPPDESIKCARCGAYFGRQSAWAFYGGRYYHQAHTPQVIDAQRRR